MSASAMKRHIDKIRRLFSVAGLTPKDFFLTQPPPPNRKDDAYPGWKAREGTRRRIARYMSRCGISAHDLAPNAQIATEQLDMFPAEPFAGPATAPSREDCIYPDCLITTDFGAACEHSCPWASRV